MIITYAEEKLKLLAEELDLFNEMGISPAQILSGKLKAIRSTLAEIKSEVHKNGFTNKEEEVAFFKVIKPQFTCAYIFELEKFKIEAEKPTGTEEFLEAYYHQELIYCNRFFAKQQYHYQYFLYNGSDLDEIYFTRTSPSTNILLMEYDNADPSFSTPADYLFGKFLALEKLRKYLLIKITNPLSDEEMPVLPKLKWTGDNTNIIELIYGLWLTRQINFGEATLIQITRWFESNFDISLKNIQMQFAQIKSRKRLSVTKYIDLMRDEILKKIEEEYK